MIMSQKYAKMCIPDLDVLVDYPIDYKLVSHFTAFIKAEQI